MKLGDLLRYINFDEKIEICTQELETNFCEVKHKGQWKREDVPEKWLDYDLVGIFPLVIDHSLGLRVLVEVEVGYEHAEFKIGDKVISEAYGKGVVVDILEESVEVDFDEGGSKYGCIFEFDKKGRFNEWADDHFDIRLDTNGEQDEA